MQFFLVAMGLVLPRPAMFAAWVCGGIVAVWATMQAEMIKERLGR